MALFILCDNSSSSPLRICTLALITLVFVCSFSYCSSSSSSSSAFGSPTDDIGNNVENLNIDHNLDSEEDYQYRLPARSFSSLHHYVDAPQHPMLSKHRFLELLLKSALTQPRDHHHQQVHINNRRYAPQSFHAMRG